MTKKYKYIEYEKLGDVVRDWENGEQIYQKEYDELAGENYSICLNTSYFTVFKNATYAKRVEIKEKTVEAWAAISPDGLLIEVSFDELEILDQYAMKVDRYGWKIVKLTGTCKE